MVVIKIHSFQQRIQLLHLQCLIEMTSYFFAYDRISYARYIPAYLIEMLTFLITHLDAHQSQLNGEFAVQCSYKNKRDRRNMADQLQSTI